MKKITYAAFLIFCCANLGCYNYDGPTRSKIEIVQRAPLTPPPPRIIAVEKKEVLSQQDYLKQMANEIKKQLPSAQIIMLQDSIKVLFPDNIKYSSSGILPMDNINPEIKKLAGLIVKFDKTNVLVTGHTDKTGDEKNNKNISEMRAKYIMDLLLAYNAPKNRLAAWGLGSNSPISSSRVENANDNNRRVEFIVLSTMSDEEEEIN